ncbi:hypothetical protein OS493_019342 [Desmophyllum pertusum]|uniref:Uncharacterized protein n=1 Tax=Desmophyllum pertusum TaxID=174260 RepID=A0A9X0D987_9CNID|nr:hypothetical protein OS493_019342 [Desmophyllum pertusum]
MQGWERQLTGVRGLPSLLVKELRTLGELKEDLIEINYEMYILDRDNDLEYVAKDGNLDFVVGEGSEQYSSRRNELQQASERVQKIIKEVVDKRVALITSEISKLNGRRKLNFKAKNKLNKMKDQRGQMLYVGEIRSLLKLYLKMIDDLERCAKKDFMFKVGSARLEKEKEDYERESKETEEYGCQLNSDFYLRVGTVEGVGDIVTKFKGEMANLVAKHKVVISDSEKRI